MTTALSIYIIIMFVINTWLAHSDDTQCVSQDGSLVATKYGCVRGIINDMGRSFTSIPYAQPPIPENNLRFRNPIEPNSWTPSVLNATTIAPQCMMSECGEWSITCYASTEAVMSEDCLYLNIYTPPFTTSQDPLPVMFWIHGGTYKHQWSGSALYEGQTMANLNNVIVVTINYRIGSLGFFYDPSNGFEGNYGYFDQLLALNFVHENIEYFGGDKAKTVLFGNSAGAMSVATLLMNASNTMYSGAIMQSNPFGLPFRMNDSWQKVPSTYVEYTGCDDSSQGIASCLRSQVTANELIEAQKQVEGDTLANCKWFDCYFIHMFLPWTPTFKTKALPQVQPLLGIQSGEYNTQVPIIIGSTKDEGVVFIYDLLNSIHGSYEVGLCKDEYESLVHAIMGTEYGDKIIAQYAQYEPTCSQGDYRPLLSRIAGEFWFVCAARNATQSISTSSSTKVWKYHYNYLYKFAADEYFGDNIYCDGEDGNVCHGAELPIMFESATLNFTKQERDLSDVMQQCWTNLALSQEPGVGWKEYNQRQQWTKVFTEEATNEMQMRYEESNDIDCEFYDDMGYPELFWNDAVLNRFPTNSFGSRSESDDVTECSSDCSSEEEESDETSLFALYQAEQSNSVYLSDVQMVAIYFVVAIVFLGVGFLVGSEWIYDDKPKSAPKLAAIL
eukprot:78216_1